ncbi:MAG TPA: response regulator [Pyrinomonadaceae bacterium]|jgi:two-component system response regulator PilR (NtrC family)
MAAILVVDDDATIRDMLYDLFEENHRCHLAETAEQALLFLETEHYDVILTDISMPGLSGLELLGYMRQSQPETPVIVITGIQDQEHAQGLLKLGAFHYLLKPFRLEVVEESVEKAIEFHRRQTKK